MAAPVGNRYALGNNGGRPPVYATPEELEQRIIEYFDQTDLGRPTITGLALFLGFDTKKSLYDYAKKEEFLYPIKRALSIVENEYEKALLTQSATGAIFALKNMEWSDKTQTELTGKDGKDLITGFRIVDVDGTEI